MGVLEIFLVLICVTQVFLKHFCILETACCNARIFWLQGLSSFNLNLAVAIKLDGSLEIIRRVA